ncbi:Gram-negative bacterial tonB protein [compost metagenome]
MLPIRNIRFSFPCKEEINEMTSCDQGKHCGSCKRTIVDFRNKSKEELDLLREMDKDICGIFSEKQVAKGYENYRQLIATTILTLGIVVLSSTIHAQEEIDPFKSSLNTSKEHAIIGVIMIDKAETPTADYPGGIAAIRSFFKEHIVYPSDSVEGKVYVSIIVDTLGRVTNVRIKKSLSPLADAEVIRVVKLMIFNPALVNGKPVNSRIYLPCSFRLGKEE